MEASILQSSSIKDILVRRSKLKQYKYAILIEREKDTDTRVYGCSVKRDSAEKEYRRIKRVFEKNICIVKTEFLAAHCKEDRYLVSINRKALEGMEASLDNLKVVELEVDTKERG